MRQRLGEKKTRALEQWLGLPIASVWVRGGTGHRKDIHLRNGCYLQLYPDGRLYAYKDRMSREPAVVEDLTASPPVLDSTC